MLIQHVAGAVGARLVPFAFGFGAAETRPVGFGLLRRLMPFDPLLKSLQIDDVRHAGPHQATRCGRAAFSLMREGSRWTFAGSLVIQKIPVRVL
jgi:hypothetical protein